MFLHKVQNHNCYIYISILTTQNISGTLFVLCLSIKIFCLTFSDILTLKCINHTYLAEDYSLNTPSTTYLLVFHFSFALQNINRTFFLTLKPLIILSSTLFLVCVLPYTLFLLFFAVKLVIASAKSILFHFNLEKYNSYLCFSVLATVDLFYCLF